MTIGKTIDEMLGYLESLSALNYTERAWATAIGDFYPKNKFLSEKQKLVIEDIYFRYTVDAEIERERFIQEEGEVIINALAEVPETDPEEDPS